MKKQTKKENKKEVTTETKDWKNMLVQLEDKLVEISTKLPKLPDSVGEFLVKYGPYLMIVGLVVSVFGLLTTFGLLATINPLVQSSYPIGYNFGYRSFFSFSALVGLVSMVFTAIAIPGLLKRAKSAWNLMFYASLVTLVSYLITMNLGSLVIGTAISWYILFQIRKFYK